MPPSKAALHRLALPLLMLAAAACGGKEVLTTQGGQTTCSPGQAQLAVRDTTLQALCGCSEGDTRLLAYDTPLVCTVPAGTVVYFHYLGTRLRHAVVSTGSPAFTSSPLSDPGASLQIRVHAVPFEVTGTYGFQDAFNYGLRGQIIVQ